MSLFSSKLFKVESNKAYICIHYSPCYLYLGTLKGVAGLKEFDELRTTISTESAQGEWKGTSTPGIILGGRRGQLLTFCPFDNKAGNYNVTVVGRSGAGKSVFMQELMSSTLGLGGSVFILDVGRSFEKTCHMLGGQFIEFSIDKDVCLNPFSGIDPNNPEASSDALTMLKSVLQLMTLSLMAAPIKGVDDKGASLLEQAMNESFNMYGSETLARRLRKYRGSLVVGTQSVNDFYACAGAQAAWDNSDWNCFLSQKPESIAQLKLSNKILLDEDKEQLMTSVKTIHGKYAEVLINGAEGYAVGKLLLDPFSNLLFSTKAEDYAAIKELQKSGMTVAEAVEHLLGEHLISEYLFPFRGMGEKPSL